MNINWKVRIANKAFWVSMIPAVILLIQTIASILGFTIDLGDIGNKILSLVDVIFVILALLGVVNDPTTKGIGDSERAMTYDVPN